MWQASARPAAANSRMLCACLAAAIASAACATSGGGGAQTKLLVTTEPAGATLFVNGANMGPTPVTLPVKPEERSLALRLAYEGLPGLTGDGHAPRTRTSREQPASRRGTDRQGKASDPGGAVVAAAVAATVTAIDRKTGSAGRLDPVRRACRAGEAAVRRMFGEMLRPFRSVV